MKRTFFSFIIAAALIIGISNTAQATTVTLQPNAAQGKDVCVSTGFSGNMGSNVYLTHNFGDGHDTDGLIEFNLGFLSGMTVSSASLSLYQEANVAPSGQFGIYRITSSWAENTVTWATRPSFYGTPCSTLTITDINSYVWRTWDVTTLLQDWADGSYANNGMMLSRIDRSNPVIYFTSSDWDGATYDPKLTIAYSQTVPEPATLGLLSLGLFGVGFFKKRKMTI